MFQSEVKKSAEIAAYFQRYEEAERIYLDMDRRYENVTLRFLYSLFLFN